MMKTRLLSGVLGVLLTFGAFAAQERVPERPKVALVLGVAGLVGVLFAAGASHDETPQSNT